MLDMTLFLIPFIALVALGQAQSFINPPAGGAIHDYSEDPIYSISDKIDIQWDVSWSTVSLWLWQNDNPVAEPLLDQVKNTGKLSWQIQTDKDYSAQSGTNGTVFFFQVVGSGQQVISHYFNLTGPVIPSTSNSPSATSTANNLVSVASGSGPSPTQTPETTFTTTVQVEGNSAATAVPGQSSAASTQSATTSHDNTSLATGLGVAFGLVFAGLVGAMIYIFLRRRQNQKQQHEETAQVPGSGPGAIGDTGNAEVDLPSTAATLTNPGASGSYGEKGPVGQAPVEIAGGMANKELGRNGSMRVLEMPDADQGAGPRQESMRHVSGVHEMPVGHTRNGSTGMFSEEGG